MSTRSYQQRYADDFPVNKDVKLEAGVNLTDEEGTFKCEAFTMELSDIIQLKYQMVEALRAGFKSNNCLLELREDYVSKVKAKLGDRATTLEGETAAKKKLYIEFLYGKLNTAIQVVLKNIMPSDVYHSIPAPVRGADNGFELLDWCRSTYSSTDENLQELRISLQAGVSLRPTETSREVWTRINAMAGSLTGTEYELTTKELAAILAKTVGSRVSRGTLTSLTAISIGDDDDKVCSKEIERLLRLETKVESHLNDAKELARPKGIKSSHGINIVKSEATQGGEQRKRRPRKDVTCYGCGEKGHYRGDPECQGSTKSRTVDAVQSGNRTGVIICSKCKERNHYARDCRASGDTSQRRNRLTARIEQVSVPRADEGETETEMDLGEHESYHEGSPYGIFTVKEIPEFTTFTTKKRVTFEPRVNSPYFSGGGYGRIRGTPHPRSHPSLSPPLRPTEYSWDDANDADLKGIAVLGMDSTPSPISGLSDFSAILSDVERYQNANKTSPSVYQDVSLSNDHLYSVSILKRLANGEGNKLERGLFQHDSGAAYSIVNDINLLDPSTRKKVNKRFRAASGADMVSECHGLVRLVKRTGCSFVSVPAYYLPMASANLMAAIDLENMGYRQTFERKQIVCDRDMKDHLSLKFILDPVSKSYVFQGRAKYFSTESIHLTSAAARPWHSILGHPGKETFLSMAQIYNDIDGDNEQCDSCAAAYLTKSASRAKVVKAIGYTEGDCISVDLLLYPTGLLQYTCACVVVDYTTNYVMLSLHKHKQVLPAIKYAVQRCENVHGVRPRYVRMDSGSEFANTHVEGWAQEQGISITYAAQGDHMQNGLVESHIGLLKGITRALLIEGGYPESYWVYALQHAANLLNLRPSRKSYFTSRYEAFHGKGPPSLSNLHVFGQIVFYHPNVIQSKLLARGRRGVYLGTDKEYRSVIILDLETRGIHMARNVHVPAEVTFPTVPRKGTTCPESTVTRDALSHSRAELDLTATKRRYVKSGKYAKKDKALATKTKDVQESRDPSASQKSPPKKVSFYEGGTQFHESTFSPSQHVPQMPPDVLPEEEISKPDPIMLLGPKGDQAQTYVPKSYDEAMKSEESHIWKEVVSTEYDSIIFHEVLDVVPRKASDNILASYCLLNAKLNQDGHLDKRKARFAINGSSQIEGVDVDDTYSPVADFDTVRILVGHAVKHKFQLSQADVKTAYYYGVAKGRVVFRLPPGFVDYLSWEVSLTHGAEKRHLIKTRKSQLLEKYEKIANFAQPVGMALKGIPGSKDAGCLWFEQLTKFFIDQGFTQLKSSKCVFVRNDDEHGYVFVIAYVDDLIIGGKHIEWLHDALRKRFEIKISDLSWFLGVKFEWNEAKTSVKLSQKAFAQSILEEFNCSDINPSPVPLRADAKLSLQDCPPHGAPTKFPLRTLIGKVLYLARMTRPDLLLAVSVLSRFVDKPGLRHAQAAKVLLAYIAGTIDQGITLDVERPANNFVAFADAEFANLDLDTRRSYGAFCVYYAGGPVAFNVARYPRVAGSTSVAEYYTLSRAAERIMWCRQLMREIDLAQHGEDAPIRPPIVVYEDNNTALNIANGTCKQKHTKHVEIRYHVIQDFINHGDIEVKKLPGKHMMIDAINKCLGPKEQSLKAAYLLGTLDISTLI